MNLSPITESRRVLQRARRAAVRHHDDRVGLGAMAVGVFIAAEPVWPALTFDPSWLTYGPAPAAPRQGCDLRLRYALPKGFMRIRHYGLLANRHRTEHLAACRAALDAPTPAPAEPQTVEAFLSRVLGTDANRCPHCGQGRLRPIRVLPLPSGHPPAMGG